LSIVATKFAGSIEGEYFPWIGARLDAEDDAALVDGVALDGEVARPPDETHCVLTTTSRPKATVETAAGEIRLSRFAIPSSNPVEAAIVAVGG
jgi:hypothetical protein